MCGRFTLRTPSAAWCQLFLVDPQEDHEWPEEGRSDGHSQTAVGAAFGGRPRYNIAPTQQLSAVTRPQTGHPRRHDVFRWGLVPSWAQEISIGQRMINARGETVDAKPSFRSAFRSRRCLIPADGYYEWKRHNGGKQPFLIERFDGGMLAMAGLWEENRKVLPHGTPLRTCTIITTAANHQTAAVHDRMPVFVDVSDHERWLDPANTHLEELKSLLRPAPEDLLRITAISPHVNNARHEDAQCIQPMSRDVQP